MRLNSETLARASARRPWLTLVVWVVAVLVGGFVVSRLLTGVLTTEFDFTNRPESKVAADLVEKRLRGPQKATELVIVRSRTATVDDPGFRSFVEDLQAGIKALGPNIVDSVSSTYETEDPSLVSRDRHATMVPVVMAGTLDDAQENIDRLHEVTDRAGDGFQVLVAGQATLFKDFNDLAEQDLQRGESIGLIAALLVLVVVFGALVAAVLPIFMGITAIVLALAGVALIGQVADFSFFVTNMVTMMGLAVGIDYSLFIVSRYREERRRGKEKPDAIAAAGATAGRAVFFSGSTVVLALVGMLLIPTTIFRSLAGGAILVVVAAVLAAMTLLPAVLSLLGDRVNAVRVFRHKRGVAPAPGRGFWNRVSNGVMARPVISLVIAAGIMVAAGISYFSINTGFSGVATLPDRVESKQAFQVLATEFEAGGALQPAEVVVDADVTSPQAKADIARLQGLLADDPLFGPTRVETNDAGDLAVITVPVAIDPDSEEAGVAFDRIREDYVPRAFDDRERVLVGGQLGLIQDFFDVTDTFTPIVFVIVLGLSFILLTVVFRSIVVPVKAILMNLLSVGAAYGLIVLVFQKGVGAELFGFEQVSAIEAWLPLFLFSVLFGLSMDYHVFLLTRIRERWDQTKDNRASVAHGLRTTGGIITGAALIMVAVFLGFASGDLVSLQQMGFGLAVAVFLDATVVRSVLVPATMRLLGDLNWYLPRWLRWLPDLKVEGVHAAEEAAPPEPREAARL